MFQPFIAFNPFMDKASAHGLLLNQEYSFLNSLLLYVWYSWNLFFFKGCLTGPPSHRQNSNFWQGFCLWILASVPIFQHGTTGREYLWRLQKTIKVLLETLAFHLLLRLRITEIDWQWEQSEAIKQQNWSVYDNL